MIRIKKIKPLVNNIYINTASAGNIEHVQNICSHTIDYYLWNRIFSHIKQLTPPNMTPL